MTQARQVAVIGAGLAGATFAHTVARQGADVVVFEKARGVGGRMSTRRTPPFTFDHGAPCFTTQSAPFRLEVGRWAKAHVAAQWEGRLATIEHGAWQPRAADGRPWVGTPTMNSPVKHLLEGIEVRRGCRVGRVESRGRRWILRDAAGADVGAFDDVVVATPAAQAVPLLAARPALAAVASAVELAPCWAEWVAFDEPIGAPFDAATVRGGPLQWVALEGSKPARPVETAGEAWVLHASAAWSGAHVDDAKESVAGRLLDAFRALPGVGKVPSPRLGQAHRWLYARVVDAAGVPHLWDGEAGLGACGDWCLGPRVEDAWASGHTLGEAWSAR